MNIILLCTVPSEYFCAFLTISQETAVISLFRFNQLSMQHVFNVRKKLNLYIVYSSESKRINPLNAELNPICHLPALLRAHHIFHVSGLRVKYVTPDCYSTDDYRGWKYETELWRI